MLNDAPYLARVETFGLNSYVIITRNGVAVMVGQIISESNQHLQAEIADALSDQFNGLSA